MCENCWYFPCFLAGEGRERDSKTARRWPVTILPGIEQLIQLTYGPATLLEQFLGVRNFLETEFGTISSIFLFDIYMSDWWP